MNVDARWATQQLEVHTARRRALGFERHVAPVRTKWDQDDEAAPPAFALSDDPAAATATTPTARVASGAYSAAPGRWESRFRDGRPPPPPPLPPITDRDVAMVMRSLGIDPAHPGALAQLELQVEDGALGPDPDDPTGRQSLDVYGYIRGVQRAQQKRAGRRSVLVPQAVLDQTPTPHLNDRSGGGPMYPGTDPAHLHPAARAYPTDGGSETGVFYPATGQPSAPPPPHYPAPVYDGSFPALAAEGYPSGSTSTFRTAQASPLTQSQKRRLRRKKQRQQGTSTSSPPSPVVPDLWKEEAARLPTEPTEPTEPTVIEQRYPQPPPPPPSPVVPTNGDADWTSPEADRCGASIPVWFTAARPTILTCPLTPYPHPNQPHIVQIDPERTQGVEVFVGWWDADLADQGAPV